MSVITFSFIDQVAGWLLGFICHKKKSLQKYSVCYVCVCVFFCIFFLGGGGEGGIIYKVTSFTFILYLISFLNGYW